MSSRPNTFGDISPPVKVVWTGTTRILSPADCWTDFSRPPLRDGLGVEQAHLFVQRDVVDQRLPVRNCPCVRASRCIEDVPDDDDSFKPTSDVLNARSIFGWRLSRTLALSSMTEYRTSLLNGRFNNPGYLDIGSLGLAWTPTPNFSAVLHSLNYNFVFSRGDFNFEGSLGAKLVVDYEQVLAKGIAWRSNFSAFTSYKDFNELSNWTWSNNFSTAIKGFGVGLDLALRSNKQESRAAELADNPLQFFWVLGVSYNLSKEL